MTSSVLPSSVVLNFPGAASNPFIYTTEDGSVGDGSDSVFNAVVKIVVEEATVDTKYVHLRFSYNNRYWQKSTSDNSIVAISLEAVEDTTDPSCTLFEPSVTSDNQVTFTHVQTGWPVVITGNTLNVVENGSATALGCQNVAELVQLPKDIALKGPNGKYLVPVNDKYGPHMVFSSDDPNVTAAWHTVTLLPYGYVRFLDHEFNDHWLYDPASYWVSPGWVDGQMGSYDITVTHFWPIKIDDSTIALRSAYINLFCSPLSNDFGSNGYVAATSETTNDQTNWQVQELVSNRSIYNVVYRMEDAKIYAESPFLAGSVTLINATPQDNSQDASITYTDEKSYTFSRGFTVSLGVDTTIEAEVPFIFEDKISFAFNISGTFNWDTTTTTTTSVTATATVTVPAMTSVTVEYVGTSGTCNIPYSYSQQDQSSTTGTVTNTDQIDGIYQGVSYYNFQFRSTEKPLTSAV